jgi:hypothetical protein
MLSDRSKVILLAIAIILFFIALFLFDPNSEPKTVEYWLGLVIGAGAGVLTCRNLNKSWDPENLELKDPDAKPADPRWLPLAVIGGIIASNVLSPLLGPTFSVIILNSFVMWLVIFFGYMVFQAWWHRPQ